MSVQITDRDYEQFSAYLDGQLASADLQRLETRLKADPQLRAALDELAATRTLLRGAKRLRAPRNFTISPETARQYARKPLLPFLFAFRFSAALSALSLIAVLAFEGIVLLPQLASKSTAMSPGAAPAMAPAASERTAVQPTMGIQWQAGPPPASGMGGGPSTQSDSQNKASPGMGGGGDGNNTSPIQGQVEVPQIAVQGLQQDNPPALAPQATGPADHAASPILGVPAPGDGGKIIDSYGNLQELPTSALDQPAPGETAAATPTRRVIEIGLIALAVLAGIAALLFQRIAPR